MNNKYLPIGIDLFFCIILLPAMMTLCYYSDSMALCRIFLYQANQCPYGT